MIEREQYVPSPLRGVGVERGKDKWTLILVRELRHSPEKVWESLTDPAHLREWAPFVVDANLGAVGKVNLTWVANPTPIETKVTWAEAPKLLEYGDMKWELEPSGKGTRLTLWHSIDKRFITWGASGWHIALDVLDRKLDGNPMGRIVGADAMKFAGWQQLVGEYAKEFGIEPPSQTPKPLKR